MKKVLAALILAVCLLASAAFADSVSFNGTVKNAATVEVYAPIGGTVEKVLVETGEAVTADTVLARLKTTKVYATEDGTVTAVFGEPGDNAETVTNRFGALIYIEGSVLYTVEADTGNAYNATANHFVHVGETVYLQSRTKASHTGEGSVTSVSGTGFGVDVRSGEFLLDESVEIFRKAGFAASSRIGRGSIARKAPSAVTASGSIVSYAVHAGDTVKRGDLLLETLDGSFDGLYMSGTELYANADGIISQIGLTAGSPVQKDSVMAVIWPRSAMRIEADIAETDLCYVHVGDPVTVELNWNQDEDVTYEGTVTAIASIANDGAENVTYTVYIDFNADENTRYGMSAVITTTDRSPETQEDTDINEDEQQQEEDGDTSHSGRRFPADGEFPGDGQFPSDMPFPGDGQFPAGRDLPTDGQ